MASRPVYCPNPEHRELVQRRDFEFRWHSGFAASQKKRNVEALHRAAAQAGLSSVLEVSTKSEHGLGQAFSAFRLKIRGPGGKLVSLEGAYQGSKRFTHGGPYPDLMVREPKEAKRDHRLRSSGDLVCFEFAAVRWPLEPTYAFYDWLFMRALADTGLEPWRLSEFDGFTDIEFNPQRSLNTQAHACALVAALLANGELTRSLESPSHYLRLLGAEPLMWSPTIQSDMFGGDA